MPNRRRPADRLSATPQGYRRHRGHHAPHRQPNPRRLATGRPADKPEPASGHRVARSHGPDRRGQLTPPAASPFRKEPALRGPKRSEEHTYEHHTPQRISYAVL